MSPKFHFDWRCASTGIPDVVAERRGVRTRVRHGVWGDWQGECVNESEFPHRPSYRFLIDDSTGQIIGGTLYGTEAGKLIERLKFLIDAELCENELSGLDATQSLQRSHAK